MELGWGEDTRAGMAHLGKQFPSRKRNAPEALMVLVERV
jgi:hypothetical protein